MRIGYVGEGVGHANKPLDIFELRLMPPYSDEPRNKRICLKTSPTYVTDRRFENLNSQNASLEVFDN